MTKKISIVIDLFYMFLLQLAYSEYSLDIDPFSPNKWSKWIIDENAIIYARKSNTTILLYTKLPIKFNNVLKVFGIKLSPSGSNSVYKSYIKVEIGELNTCSGLISCFYKCNFIIQLAIIWEEGNYLNLISFFLNYYCIFSK